MTQQEEVTRFIQFLSTIYKLNPDQRASLAHVLQPVPPHIFRLMQEELNLYPRETTIAGIQSMAAAAMSVAHEMRGLGIQVEPALKPGLPPRRQKRVRLEDD
jgi:hypothetical protein